jgi:uncharacterized membrane protein
MTEVQRPAGRQGAQGVPSTRPDGFTETNYVYTDYGYDRGAGWKMFASVMIIISATWNLIDSLVAILDANYYQDVAQNAGTELPLTNTIEAWGWVGLGISVIMLAAAYGIISGAMWARVVGVAAVSINMVFHMAFLAAFPFWSVIIIAIDALIIYGLIVHGGRTESTA